MNALEIANELTAPIGTSGQSTYAMCEQAAILLRRQHAEIQAFRESERELMDVRDKQHEAIVKLREALIGVQNHTEKWTTPFQLAKRALKDTEEISK